MDGLKGLANGIAEEMRRLLPRQRKTQRDNLALLVATMLDVRSANLMDLAAGLPRDVARIDMRYQWIARVLMNRLIDPDAVMAPFAREVMSRLADEGRPLALILDQSKLSDRHQVLMLAVRYGERALPVLWRVQQADAAIGFAVQKDLLDAAAPLVPEGAEVCLMADRFYGTADLIWACQERAWDYRLRLKGNLVLQPGFIGASPSCPVASFSALLVASSPRRPSQDPSGIGRARPDQTPDEAAYLRHRMRQKVDPGIDRLLSPRRPSCARWSGRRAPAWRA